MFGTGSGRGGQARMGMEAPIQVRKMKMVNIFLKFSTTNKLIQSIKK